MFTDRTLDSFPPIKRGYTSRETSLDDIDEIIAREFNEHEAESNDNGYWGDDEASSEEAPPRKKMRWEENRLFCCDRQIKHYQHRCRLYGKALIDPKYCQHD